MASAEAYRTTRCARSLISPDACDNRRQEGGRVVLEGSLADASPGGSATAGSPRAVTHPGFPQIRTCAFNAYGSSHQGLATRAAIRWSYGDREPSSKALALLPSNESLMRHPLPSPGSLRVRFSWYRGVGSEEARSVALTRASVRRSNGASSFPALRFHKGSLQA